MARADQLANLLRFLLLGYFTLSIAGGVAFAFSW